MNNLGNLLYVLLKPVPIAGMGHTRQERLKFIPCELCWYQRIMMYPLVLILGIATFQGDARVKKYVLPMAVIGAGISLMHYMEQKIPGFNGIKPCVTGVPCSGQYIKQFGIAFESRSNHPVNGE